MKGRYSFSRDNDAVAVSMFCSKGLTDRMDVLCNILEMNRSALCRYLLRRGLEDLEVKLAERANKLKEDPV